MSSKARQSADDQPQQLAFSALNNFSGAPLDRHNALVEQMIE